MSAVTSVTSQKSSRRPALPASVSFWAVAGIAFLALAANTAASPLHRVCQARFGFSATVLTLLFTVYVVAVLVTLLFLGSVSDYVGRRAVMLVGLAAGALASGLFLVADALWVSTDGRP
jgi:MFS family permease